MGAITQRTCLLAILIVLAAAGLALNASYHRSATGDEFNTIWLASQPDPAWIIQKVQQSDIHPPTYYLLLHFWGRLAGYGDAAMRVPSLLFVVLSLFTLWRLIPVWDTSITEENRRVVWILCATTPVVWIQAVFARYYALGTFLGLLSVLFYLEWLRDRTFRHRATYVLSTAATFYIHYFLAAAVVAGQAIHFAFYRRKTNHPSTGDWLLMQIAIASASLPIILTGLLPLLTSTRSNLSSAAAEGIAGGGALPIYLAGHLYATLTGGIPYPWDFWISVPVASVFFGLILRDLFIERTSLSGATVALVWIPYILLAAVIAAGLPVTGYFQGILRAGHIAILIWLLVGQMTARIAHPILRRAVVLVLLACNSYSIILMGFDLFSMFQSTPVKQAASRIRSLADGETDSVIFHPFGFGWADPLQRYLPSSTCRFIGDELTNMPMTSYQALITTGHCARVWIIQRNRFKQNAEMLSDWVSHHGYELSDRADLQEQRPYDLWFKERLKAVAAMRFSTNRSSRSYWTISGYRSVVAPKCTP